MSRQTATSTVQPRTATRLAWTLWVIYLLLQTAVLVVAVEYRYLMPVKAPRSRADRLRFQWSPSLHDETQELLTS